MSIPMKYLREQDLCLSGREHLVLYPGIEVTRNSLTSEEMCFHHAPHPELLEINYCCNGRIGWSMKKGISVYLGPGDLGIHTMELCAESTMTLPLGFYEGYTFSIDLTEARLPEILQDADIDYGRLKAHLCPADEPLSLEAGPDLDRILGNLANISEGQKLAYLKLKSLELILYLAQLPTEERRSRSRFHCDQVERIQDVHELLTSHPEQRITIEELSHRFLINTSSLKEIFREVYGQPIASYMKEFRLRMAKELLRETELSIAEIAARVGYSSQGKFSEVFKEDTGMSPNAYRKK